MIRKLKSGEYRLYSRKIDPKRGTRRNLVTFKTRRIVERMSSLALVKDGRAEPLTLGDDATLSMRIDPAPDVDAPLVFVGYGVAAPERKWDDFKGVDLHGKVAVVLVNDPDFETGAGDFGGKAMTYYGRWTYKYEEAARRGALGMLIVHETAAASYGWATVVNSNTDAIYDIVRNDPSQAHVQMEGWIQHEVAAALFKQAGLDFDALKKLAQTSWNWGFRSAIRWRMGRPFNAPRNAP